LSRRHEEPAEEDEEYQKLMNKTQFLREKAQAFEDQSEQYAKIEFTVVQAIMEARGVRRGASLGKVLSQDTTNESSPSTTSDFVPAVEQIATTPELISDEMLEPKADGITSLTMTDWRKFQLADSTLKLVLEHVRDGKKLELATLPIVTPEMKIFAREQD
jgi:hypothetical protein